MNVQSWLATFNHGWALWKAGIKKVDLHGYGLPSWRWKRLGWAGQWSTSGHRPWWPEAHRPGPAAAALWFQGQCGASAPKWGPAEGIWDRNSPQSSDPCPHRPLLWPPSPAPWLLIKPPTSYAPIPSSSRCTPPSSPPTPLACLATGNSLCF